MNIIGKEKVNKSRQIEVDLFRGFTAIIIVLCHVALYLGDNGDLALYTFGDIIGSEFGAPVFMSMLGISIVHAKANSPKQLLKRGLLLFVSGYILNFVRSFIPYLVMPNVNYFSTLEALFIIDILPFAGLSFMLIALFKKIKVPSWGMVIIALIFAGIDQWIFTLSSPITDNTALTCFLNIFVPVDEYSCFPFLTWFFFPAFGYLLGDILVRTNDKKKLYTIYLIVGSLAVIYVYGSFIYLFPNYTTYYAGNNFYYMGVFNLIVNGLLVCFGLAFWYFVSKIIPKCIEKYLTFLSKNLNIFYWFTWIIIGSMIHIFTYNNIVIKSYVAIILMIIIQVVSTLLAKVVADLKVKKEISLKGH